MNQRCRLDQILSRYGYCSRSESRAWLRNQRVRVGSEIVSDPSDKFDPREVLVDGEAIECPDGVFALLHKPAGFVCSHDAREGPTIYDLLPPRWLRRNPPVMTVGRLDKDTTGALLVTDLGELVQHFTSPRHKVPKLYEVKVDRDLPASLVDVFASGTLRLDDEDKPCLPAKLEILSPREARLEIVEGRYHQVKRMFAASGCTVTRLHRSRFGEFDLSGLAEGQWKLLPLDSVPLK